MKKMISLLTAFSVGLQVTPLKGQQLEVTQAHIGLFTQRLQTKETALKTLSKDQGNLLVEIPVKAKTKGMDISSVSILKSEPSFSIPTGWEIRDGQAYIKLLFKPLREGEIRDTLRVYYGNPAVFTSSYYLRGIAEPSDVILYPNPGSGVITLKGFFHEELVRVIDELGLMVYTATVDGENPQLNLSSLKGDRHYAVMVKRQTLRYFKK